MDETTVEGVAHGLDTHERVCAERYKRIEERLVSGESRFNRLENMIWGLYLLIFSAGIAQLFG
jgi:hypothetical protein